MLSGGDSGGRQAPSGPVGLLGAGEVPNAPEGPASRPALAGPLPVRILRCAVRAGWCWTEGLATPPARLGFLSRVDPAVQDDGGLAHGGLAAHAALEGPSVAVDGSGGASRRCGSSGARTRAPCG